ncbi:MAG: hypothetical protein V1720_15940 [bacterium]
MPFFENHAGINITGSKIQIIELAYNDGSFILENIDEQSFDESLETTSSETKFLSIIQNAFNELVSRKPLSCDSVAFSLPNQFFRVVEIPYDNTLVQEDLIEHFKWELSILYPHYKPDDFIIQNINFDKSRLRPNKHVIIVALIKNYLKMIHKFCVRNTLNLKLVDNSHIAANTSLMMEYARPKDELFVHILVSDNDVSIILLERGLPFYFKVKQFSSTIEIIPRIKEALSDIRKLGVDENMVDRYFIAGTIPLDDIIQSSKEKLNLPFMIYNPFSKLKSNPALATNSLYTRKYFQFSSPAGVAYRLI